MATDPKKSSPGLKKRTPARTEAPAPREERSIGEIIQEIWADLPDEEWAKFPRDGAEQHDHYIYGTPKK